MKQCISRVIKFITHLWQTLKKYVCKRKHIYHMDVDKDNVPEIVIDINGKEEQACEDVKEINKEKEE